MLSSLRREGRRNSSSLTAFHIQVFGSLLHSLHSLFLQPLKKLFCYTSLFTYWHNMCISRESFLEPLLLKHTAWLPVLPQGSVQVFLQSSSALRSPGSSHRHLLSPPDTVLCSYLNMPYRPGDLCLSIHFSLVMGIFVLQGCIKRHALGLEHLCCFAFYNAYMVCLLNCKPQKAKKPVLIFASLYHTWDLDKDFGTSH